MNQNYPIYTVQTECHDCYKCVRHCPCKAIKVVDGSASVIPELCVSCGTCVRICPAGAKRIRNDVAQVKFLLSEPEPVYASLAPSFMSYYQDIKPAQIIAALKKIGFAGVSETAIGAQLVSSETGKFLKDAPNGLYLSSACPAINEYVQHYLPDYAETITPLVSPLLAHCQFLKRYYGDNIKVIFIGPCAAKKLEAAAHPELLSVALTFERLDAIFEQYQIDPSTINPTEEDVFIPFLAEEGRNYPFEGGMNNTIRDSELADVNLLNVSGLLNIDRLLSKDVLSSPEIANSKTFIECLACDGGCVNGPVMREKGRSLQGMLAVSSTATNKSSLSRPVEYDLNKSYPAHKGKSNEYSEDVISEALAQVGKFSREDELNCGGCGYPTCREFATALLSGKAETAMCLSYLRKQAQRKSNALIQHIPAGVVIVDRNMQIVECNESFAKMCGESTMLAYEALPGLAGVDLTQLVDYAELFEVAFSSGKEMVRNNHIQGENILNISIFSIEHQRVLGAVIQDVTVLEMHREQISEKAREVIKKNVFTVQQIAKYLGEHMAETEVLLREVAQGYKSQNSSKGK